MIERHQLLQYIMLLMIYNVFGSDSTPGVRYDGMEDVLGVGGKDICQGFSENQIKLIN